MIEFMRSLDKGKYTRWATSLTNDELAGLIWLVGEFSIRASVIDFPLDVPGEYVNIAHRRQTAALHAIIRFQEKPMGVEEVRKYIRDAVRAAKKKNLSEKLEDLRDLVAVSGSSSTPEQLLEAAQRSVDDIIKTLNETTEK